MGKKRQQERRTIANAIGRKDWVYHEFTDLNKDIERVECYCGLDGANKLSKELNRLKSVKCDGNKLNYAASGIGGALVGGLASELVKESWVRAKNFVKYLNRIKTTSVFCFCMK